MFRWRLKKYRVVVLVPGGRRAHLAALMPHLINNTIVDEVRILLNTKNKADLEYMQGLNTAGKVNLIPLPPGVEPNGNRTVNLIYGDAIDVDCVYLKIDDDVNWMEDHTIKRVVAAKVKSKATFLASPIVINNTVCTHILQRNRRIDFIERYVQVEPGGFTWEKSHVAKRLHWYLLERIRANSVEDLHVADQLVATTRLSINFICFLGKDMKELGGTIPEYWRGGHQSDEEYLTVHAPAVLKKANVVVGNALAAHHSFFPQTQEINRTLILENYQSIAQQKYSATIPRAVIPESRSVIFPADKRPPHESTMVVSFPQQGSDFVCDRLGAVPEFRYYREFFNPVVNTKDAESLKSCFGAEGDDYEEKIFQRPSGVEYSNVLIKTWDKHGYSLTKENFSPSAIELHSKTFSLVGLFRHRSLTVPTTYPHLSFATWNSFVKNTHQLPALKALKRELGDEVMDSNQKELAAHLAHWYSVFVAFEKMSRRADFGSTNVIDYTDVMSMSETELSSLFGSAFPISKSSAALIAASIVRDRFEGEDTSAWLNRRRRVYQSMDVEDWYQKLLQDCLLAADPSFRQSSYFQLLA